ncbi:MAG: hypothetical protein QXF55_04075 [Candidatus Aenigmatarchaeota archaeon]
MEEVLKIILGLGLIVLLIGLLIASYPSDEDKVQVINADFDRVFNAIVILLNQKGYPVAMASKDTGVINTEWKVEASFLSLFTGNYSREKLNIIIRRIGSHQTQVRLLITQESCSLWCSPSFLGASKFEYRTWFDDIRRAVSIYRGSSRAFLGIVPKLLWLSGNGSAL